MRASLTQTQARLISSRFSGGRGPAPAFAFLPTCRHSSPLLYHAPKALAMDGVVLGLWWLHLVSAPKPIRGNFKAYLEQRLRGVRKTSPHFCSHLHLSGLWAAQVISPSQPVASAQLMLRYQSQGHPSVHSHLASAVCSRLAALGEDPLRTVEAAQRKEVHRAGRYGVRTGP